MDSFHFSKQPGLVTSQNNIIWTSRRSHARMRVSDDIYSHILEQRATFCFFFCFGSTDLAMNADTTIPFFWNGTQQQPLEIHTALDTTKDVFALLRYTDSRLVLFAFSNNGNTWEHHQTCLMLSAYEQNRMSPSRTALGPNYDSLGEPVHPTSFF